MEAMTETQSDEITKVCRDGQISETVVTAVAEAKGVDPLSLEPLYTAIDSDALNQIFDPSVGSPPTALEVSFSVEGCQVVVQGDGEVTVTPPAANDEGPTTFVTADE